MEMNPQPVKDDKIVLKLKITNLDTQLELALLLLKYVPFKPADVAVDDNQNNVVAANEKYSKESERREKRIEFL